MDIINNILNFDAHHYYNIKKIGYFGDNIAFFPLFPYIWRLLNVGALGICAFNAIVFVASLSLLSYNFNFSSKTVLFCISLPSSIFFALPYSESIFFFCSVLLLIGLRRDSLALLITSLFFSTLARPSFTVFIPALILTYWYEIGFKRSFLWKLSILFIPILLGIVVVSIIQFRDTGLLFQFFAVQSKWGNHLQFPTLPLRGWGGDYAVRLEAIALFSGIIFICYLSYLILKRLMGGFPKLVSKPIIFALSYLSSITLMVLCFRGGSLFSLNRFVFSTAFFMIIIHFYMESNIKLSKSHIYTFLFLSLLFGLLFASYTHIQNFLLYGFLSLYLVSFILIKLKHPLLPNLIFYSLILMNFIFQASLFFRFLENEWIG